MGKTKKVEFTKEEVKVCVDVILEEITNHQIEIDRLMKLVTHLVTEESIVKDDKKFGMYADLFYTMFDEEENLEENNSVYGQLYKKLK